MLWVTKLCGDGGWYLRAWQTEFQDPQNPPKHLARAVSNENGQKTAAKKGDHEAQRVSGRMEVGQVKKAWIM